MEEERSSPTTARLFRARTVMTVSNRPADLIYQPRLVHACRLAVPSLFCRGINPTQAADFTQIRFLPGLNTISPFVFELANYSWAKKD